MNNIVVRCVLGLLLSLPVIAHHAFPGRLNLRPLSLLENGLYDMRARYSAPAGIDPRVVIIDIDESSLARLGQWPWKRDIVARLVDTLFDRYEIEVLGFDVVFAEPDIDPTLQALRNLVDDADVSSHPGLRELAERPSRDEILATSLDRNQVVMGYTFRDTDRQDNAGRLPAPLFDKSSGVSVATEAMTAKRYTANLATLQGQRPGGFFSLFNGFDDDGILRRVPLLTKYEDGLYPLLALAVAARYLGLSAEPVVVEQPGQERPLLEALDLGLYQVEIDPLARVYVPYRQSPGFRYISAVDVIDQEVNDPESLAGVVALLGTSAAGLVDLRATPVSTVLPGVEVHANLVAAMMDDNFLRAPAWVAAAVTLSLCLIAVLLAALLPRLNAPMMTTVAGSCLLIVTAVNFWLWEAQNLVIPLAPFIVLTGLLYLLNIVWGYLVESRSRRALRRSFGLYVPAEIIDSMQDQSVEALLRSEKKSMTVLFADVRGFTTISESMEPQELSDLINAFLTPMTEVVHQHGGAIDKYMGDALMAFWGAPLDEPDHARKAVDTAVAMTRALERLNPAFTDRGWPQISVGIGINTGEMNVGNMGSEFRMAYTVLGDAVNLGARLEGLTKAYGVPIVLSEYTAARCDNYLLCELDLVRVKGRQEPIRLFTPLGLKSETTAQDEAFCAQFSEALDQYRLRNWDAAQRLFTALASRAGEPTEFAQPAVSFYLARIGQLIAQPPGKDWDGVYDFETK